jgi:hypothetical protein
VHLALDIFQGLGVAAAVGIRPFLPALLVGALGAGDVQIDFKGTDYSFLQAWPFLLAMALAAVGLALLERRLAAREDTALLVVLSAAGLALGALMFAGALAQDHHTSWPGIPAGIACAALAIAATRPLLARVRARLAGGDAAALPAYAEGLALAAALLSVLAPGVGVVLILGLGWLLLAGRRREGQKYAGLRILR